MSEVTSLSREPSTGNEEINSTLISSFEKSFFNTYFDLTSTSPSFVVEYASLAINLCSALSQLNLMKTMLQIGNNSMVFFVISSGKINYCSYF